MNDDIAGRLREDVLRCNRDLHHESDCCSWEWREPVLDALIQWHRTEAEHKGLTAMYDTFGTIESRWEAAMKGTEQLRAVEATLDALREQYQSHDE